MAVMPLLRTLFDRGEEGPALADEYGDSYRFTRDTLIKRAAGKSLPVREGLRRKIDELRDEVAGPDASALERILAERIALCWFDVNEADRLSCDDRLSDAQADALDLRRERSQKRLLAACRTLATVRKLGVPTIQVNVARRQVNVAGGGGYDGGLMTDER